MADYTVSEAAELLGVSDDTVRRLVDRGDLQATKPGGHPRMLDGRALARFAERRHAGRGSAPGGPESARNRLAGLVTKVVRDKVMAQVDIQAGPFRIVSLVSREAADELGLEPGSMVVAAVKATNVVVELPTR